VPGLVPKLGAETGADIRHRGIHVALKSIDKT